MNCTGQTAELVECARRGEQPGAQLRAHLAGCAPCSERWAAECELTASFQAIRNRATRSLHEDRPLAWARRESLLRDFAWKHRRTWSRTVFSVRGFAAAAAVLLAVGIGQELATRVKRQPLQHVPAARVSGGPQTVFYEASADADSLSSDDFIAVPYALPLAMGERVTVVRADLYPEELASMGIDIDPDPDGLPADVVLGQDGFPRAVRIAETSQF